MDSMSRRLYLSTDGSAREEGVKGEGPRGPRGPMGPVREDGLGLGFRCAEDEGPEGRSEAGCDDDGNEA